MGGPIQRLRDGTAVLLRPIRPDDRDKIAAGFEKLSPESRYRRFFSPTPKLTAETLRYLTSADGIDHVAIGAANAETDGSEGEGLGIARFIRLENEPDIAEASIAVIDEKQNLGLGHLLLEELVRQARARGIRKFRGYVLRENAPMRALLDELDPEAAARTEGEYLVYDLPLPEAADEAIAEGPLHHALRLAAQGLQIILRALAPKPQSP